MMKILITGGTGLIGRALLQALYSGFDKPEVIVLTRDPVHGRGLVPAAVKLEQDLSKINFSELDAVVNLAGEPIVEKRWNEAQKQRLCESRWRLTERIVDKINQECAEQRPIRFISGSAVGFYGRQDTQIITEEFKKPFPEFCHALCQRWEDIASQAKPANTSILRTGIALSPQGGALKKMLLPFKLGMGGKVASGEQYMPWIHIDDMVAGIIYLLKHPVLTGPYNMTAPHPVTNLVFSKTLAKTLGRPCIMPMPEFAINLLLGEMAELLVYGQNVIPQKLLDAGFHFKYPTLDKALKHLLLD